MWYTDTWLQQINLTSSFGIPLSWMFSVFTAAPLAPLHPPRKSFPLSCLFLTKQKVGSINIFQKNIYGKLPDFYDYRNIPIFFSAFHYYWYSHSTALNETREEKEYFLAGFRKTFLEFILSFTYCGLENMTMVSL